MSSFVQNLKCAFKQAWWNRKKLDSPKRLPHETQFLPAALALQETPVSPLPHVVMWILVAFVLLLFLWAFFGKIDITAIAQGKIVPNDRTKIIQPMETACVRAIHVSDGQSVKAGYVLVELDSTIPEADKTRLKNEHAAVRLQVVRAQSMLSALSSGRRPVLEKLEDMDDSMWQESRRLIEGQYNEYVTRSARLDAEIAKRTAEQQSVLEVVQKFKKILPIATERAADYKKLFERDFVSKHAYFEQERIRIEEAAELATNESKFKEIKAALLEAKLQKKELSAETERSSLEKINEGRRVIASLEQELQKAETRSKQMKLVSPVDGTVQQLSVHTIGGVVTPAQTVMRIVPHDDSLEIEAFFENKDIGFIREGQEAEVKIETFPYTKYGMVHAKVISVSQDAIYDEKRGLIYSSRIKMNRSAIRIDGSNIPLSPGMAVSVETKIGKRRVIEYFLSPLLQYKHESLRER